MVSPTDGKIGTREFIALILLTVGVKLADNTPMVLFKVGQNATWMLPIISAAFMIIPLFFLLSLLKKYKEKGLIELIYLLLGKYVGFIIGFLLFLATFASLVLNTRSTVNITSTLFYPTTPIIVLLLLFIGAAFFVANRGLEAIGRTAWVSTPYIFGTLLLLFVFSIAQLRWEYLFPLAGPGGFQLMKEGLFYSSILGEFIIFAVLFPFVKTYENFRFASLLGLGIVVALLSFGFALFVMIFDFPQIESIAFPFQQVTKMVEIRAILANYEGFFIGLWIIASVVRFAIYLYVSTMIFSKTLGLKEFEPLLIPIAGLAFFLALIPENPTETLFIYSNEFIIQTSWVILICLPILLTIMSKAKGSSI